MCDYSLEHQLSRPAVVGERLVSTGFQNTPTRGFTSAADINVAVCLRPGTELAFNDPVEADGLWRAAMSVLKPSSKAGPRTAVFRQVNTQTRSMHHDALELDNGTLILLTQLRPGQQAIVLQLPVDPHQESLVQVEEETERVYEAI